MDFSEISMGYWILLILIGVACGIIGYYRGRGSGSRAAGESLRSLRDEMNRVMADLDTCQKKLELASAAAAHTPPPAFDASEARAEMGHAVSENDLKIIEGIGPKIEGLFHNYDIKTWQALADAPVAKCQEVLDSGGDRYKVHDPASWPMQARMAHEGKWKELRRWQDEHLRGKL